MTHSLTLMHDEKLYELCRKYGSAARLWRQKFIGLLPEVNRRRLYEKNGFSSIFEFAAKLCGLSAEQVRLALNLEKRFEDKPALKKMLENGEASINKLTRVASIATIENEEELAEKIKVLSKSALDTLVRDVKEIAWAKNVDGSQKAFFDAKSLPGQTLKSAYQLRQMPVDRGADQGFELNSDVAAELNELNAKGIDVNELIRTMLKERREKIAKEKETIRKNIQPTESRHIPVKTRKLLKEEFGENCSIATCSRPAVIIHHTQRFSLSRNHDPKFLAPLCSHHHAIAHSIDMNFHRARERAIQ